MRTEYGSPSQQRAPSGVLQATAVAASHGQSGALLRTGAAPSGPLGRRRSLSHPLRFFLSSSSIVNLVVRLLRATSLSPQSFRSFSPEKPSHPRLCSSCPRTDALLHDLHPHAHTVSIHSVMHSVLSRPHWCSLSAPCSAPAPSSLPAAALARQSMICAPPHFSPSGPSLHKRKRWTSGAP